MSLRNRVALAGGLAAFAVLLIVAVVVYPAAGRTLRDQLDSSLVDVATNAPTLAGELKLKAASGGTVPSARVLDLGGGTLMEILDSPAAGQTGGLAPVTAQDVGVATRAEPPYFATSTYQGALYRIYTAPYGGASGAIIRVARGESTVRTSLRDLELLLAAVLIGAALATAFTGRLLAGRVLRPVARLTGAVEGVAETGDLTVRMDVPGRDEIGRLARSFTGMMAALDESIQAQRRLVADASHELRTPLTSLTTNLELLAEPEGLADPQAPAMLATALEQARELRGLINDLVDLGRYGGPVEHIEDVRLDLLAGEAVARAAGRFGQVRFDTGFEPCFVRADADAVGRAVANLLQNAVKWSPPAGVVEVRVTAGDAVRLTVADQGPGIAAEDLPYIFDRFYRSPAARALPGSGLGLSIVRQIARAHGGEVAAEPCERGALLVLTLPRMPETEPEQAYVHHSDG